jgi:hypothetical protein
MFNYWLSLDKIFLSKEKIENVRSNEYVIGCLYSTILLGTTLIFNQTKRSENKGHFNTL